MSNDAMQDAVHATLDAAQRKDAAILRAALAMESSLEHYEHSILEGAMGARVFRQLAPLFDPEHHQRLQGAYERLTGDRQDMVERLPLQRLLEDLMANERSARNFYFHQRDELKDLQLKELFGQLAREEQHHMDLVRQAIEDIDDEGRTE